MRRWFSLTRNERRLVISAAALIATTAVGVRLLGIRRLLKWADRPIGRSEHATAECATAEHAQNAEMEALVIAVDRAGRYVPGGTCLAKALALARMLRARGIAADVRVGVRTAGGFDAHAWIECEGKRLAVNGSQFTALPLTVNRKP
jgi:hypothetical protein